MKRYVLVRVGKTLLTIWFVFTLVFFLTRITGDPVEWMTAAAPTTEAARQQLRENLGLDRPILEQYVRSVTGMFTGDTGFSYYYAREVSELFAERIGYTLQLAVLTLGITILVGVPVGVLAAVRHNTGVDRATMVAGIVGSTVPNFVLGIFLIFLFSLKLRILPSGSTGGVLHYMMPVMTLAVLPAASIARLTRSSLLDVIHQDYLDFARSKGLPEWKVVLKHGLRNALVPVVTSFGFHVGGLLGGSVVVETIFAWPGIGTLIVSSAQQRDFPVVVFGVILIATAVCVINLAVDLSYGLLDPRIRNSYGKGVRI